MLNTKNMSSEIIRPILLSQFLGNDMTVNTLTNIIASGETPTHFLFTGPTGSGKTTLGRILARALICNQKKPGDVEPCGYCKNCKGIGFSSGGSCPYYSEWSGGDINEQFMDDLMRVTNHADEIVFIDEFQDIDKKFKEGLRKPLEESSAVIIIATTHEESIEDAMLNRFKSYHYELRRPHEEVAVEFLKKAFQIHEIKFDTLEQLTRVVKGYHCEMRPCAEFPRKVLVEAKGVLTDEYLDNLFGADNSCGNGNPEWDDLCQVI